MCFRQPKTNERKYMVSLQDFITFHYYLMFGPDETIRNYVYRVILIEKNVFSDINIYSWKREIFKGELLYYRRRKITLSFAL